jgi:D-alanyl-lipoteichoic acid acyltransferase DltB (MBOAT superfamily)
MGMCGIVLFLHFGMLELPALAYRRAGLNVVSLMRQPARAVSLSEFWGKRWNTAFHKLVQDFIFRPLQKRFGLKTAIMAVFVASGLLHELAISLPARGGYGLPMTYFIIQGAGILLWRKLLPPKSRPTRVVGWVLTMLWTVLPIGLLFHTAFLQRIILPMLDCLGIALRTL